MYILGCTNKITNKYPDRFLGFKKKDYSRIFLSDQKNDAAIPILFADITNNEEYILMVIKRMKMFGIKGAVVWFECNKHGAYSGKKIIETRYPLSDSVFKHNNYKNDEDIYEIQKEFNSNVFLKDVGYIYPYDKLTKKIPQKKYWYTEG